MNGFSSKLDGIEKNLWPGLRALRYRKAKRIFNRTQPGGMVHVIHFQMGQNWSIYHGKFTVEVGAFVPEVYEIFWNKAVPRRIASYHCEERKRLGMLTREGKDIWWDLTADAGEIENEVSDLILTVGEAYFSRFSSRDRLLSKWEQDRIQKELPDRKVLIMAVLLAQVGDNQRANEVLEVEFGGRYQTAFLEYARNIVTPLGLDFPMLKSVS
jgi:hypothetical protein